MAKTKITFLLLVLLYFSTRLLFLTKLPIFNDEAIYLNWGFREIHTNNLFYSLYDAKQPFLMWIFGIVETILPDPLFAGRFVSLVTGFITFVGIYRIGKEFFHKDIAAISCVLYTLIPLFTFFDRQALMESAMASVGVWSCYLLLRLRGTSSKGYLIATGIVLGLGVFIKSSGVIFILTFILLTLLFRKTTLRNMFFILLISIVSNIFLLKEPLFWETLSTNDRYSLTIQEILRFPIFQWAYSISSFSQLAFWFITPSLFIASMIGVFLILKGKKSEQKIIVYWVFISLCMLILFARNLSARYVVSFLPLVVLFSSSAFLWLFKKQQKAGFIICVVSLSIPAYFTTLQIFSPLEYFSNMSKLTKFSQEDEYVIGWPSGYGFPQVRTFLKEHGKDTIIFAGVRLDSGNPEDAIFTYFNRDTYIKPIYFDKRTIRENVEDYDCMHAKNQTYFISRDNQLAGLDKFLQEVTRIYKPEGKSYIGIYTLKTPCRGKTLNLGYN